MAAEPGETGAKKGANSKLQMNTESKMAVESQSSTPKLPVEQTIKLPDSKDYSTLPPLKSALKTAAKQGAENPLKKLLLHKDISSQSFGAEMSPGERPKHDYFFSSIDRNNPTLSKKYYGETKVDTNYYPNPDIVKPHRDAHLRYDANATLPRQKKEVDPPCLDHCESHCCFETRRRLKKLKR